VGTLTTDYRSDCPNLIEYKESLLSMVYTITTEEFMWEETWRGLDYYYENLNPSNCSYSSLEISDDEDSESGTFQYKNISYESVDIYNEEEGWWTYEWNLQFVDNNSFLLDWDGDGVLVLFVRQ